MTSTMTDEEIRESLLKLGLNIGPVVDSTREFYRRKLAKLLGEIKDEPVIEDDEGSVSHTEETIATGATETIDKHWKENLFSETYKPPIQIRARRSIHANTEKTLPSYSSSFPLRSQTSYISTGASEAGSVASEEKNTKLLCLMFGAALLFFIIYFYSPVAEGPVTQE